ncbi:GPI mannosyltransferase 2 [Favolaschia claudopus]|uniref:GPI mannosyltransferase 2 n=1 Tax=Favolaschia claudopus TaxID=2862362 RepID=A0AAW0EFU3_9AGAR
MRSFLFRLTAISRLATAAILLLATLFNPFDAATPHLLLKWDAIHFIHIARKGYVYEHEWAFLPGIHFMLSLFQSSVLAPTLVSLAIAYDASLTMYELSLLHLGSPALAKLATVLSLLPSSPVTLFFAPYAEPFFTYLSYKGMLYSAQSRYFLAAIMFTLAATFRSNGFLLSGFIIWGLLVQPLLNRIPIYPTRVLKCIILSAVPFTPFIAHNLAAYLAFCSTNNSPEPEWCTRRLPLIYSHVQSRYWDVGFMRYWTLQQLPNFIIAAPPLAAILAFSLHYLYRWSKSPTSPRRAFNSPSVAPHAIHAIVMSGMLLFASHTQIVLRLAASMPVTYWSAAWLLLEYPKWGRAWVTWSVVWGALSILLWGSFLPPA